MPRLRKSLLVMILTIAPLAFAGDRERLGRLGANFICVCGGCNQVLMQCNHLGCASRQAMLKDLQNKVDQDLDDQSVIGYFIQKYGGTVLSVPPASGFNLT